MSKQPNGETPTNTGLVAATIAMQNPEGGIRMHRFSTGEQLADFFHQCDRPNSKVGVVGVQIVLGPAFSATETWIAEPVLDFARANVITEGGSTIDTYVYRLPSGALYRDNSKVDPANVSLLRSLYQATNADGNHDPEQAAFQAWLSIVVAELVNAIAPERGKR